MKAVAKQKYVRMSPLKVRRVLNMIRGKNVEEALNILHFTPKRAAGVIEKTLRSAVSNFYDRDEEGNISTSEIFVKSASVDQGPTLRRFRPMSMGRVGRIRRKTSHISITIEDKG